MIELLFFLILAVFVLGLVVPLAGAGSDRRSIRVFSLACTAAASVLLAVLGLDVLITGTPLAITAWQAFPGIEISFFIDRLAAFFLLLIGTVAACTAVYATGYTEHMEGGNRRNILCGGMALFVLAMMLVVASHTTFSFLFFWELMAAVSFILVMYEYKDAGTTKAGIYYFVMTQLSTLFVMLGIIALFVLTSSFAIAPLVITPDAAPLATAGVPRPLYRFCHQGRDHPRSTSGSSLPTRQAPRRSRPSCRRSCSRWQCTGSSGSFSMSSPPISGGACSSSSSGLPRLSLA